MGGLVKGLGILLLLLVMFATLIAAPLGASVNSSSANAGQFEEYVISCHKSNPFRDCNYSDRFMPPVICEYWRSLVCNYNFSIPMPANASNNLTESYRLGTETPNR